MDDDAVEELYTTLTMLGDGHIENEHLTQMLFVRQQRAKGSKMEASHLECGEGEHAHDVDNGLAALGQEWDAVRLSYDDRPSVFEDDDDTPRTHERLVHFQ